MPRVAKFGWLVLAYTVGVVCWGAYVRATGSGAGCGAHWPLCDGEVLPRSAAAATLIEFSHRFTSGIALLAVVALAIWTFRTHRRRDPARTWAGLSLFLMLTEAAIGAGLVLFELVADNATMARAMFMMAHLVNTFFLLAALTLTARSLSGGARSVWRGRGPVLAGVLAGSVAVLLAGASGAVAALGDTLFPSSTLADALQADLSASSHLLIRLRVLHPFLAIVAALTMAALAPRLARSSGGFASRTSRTLLALVALQIGLGLLNVALLAPVWLQLVHLLAADAIWIAFVLLSAEALAETSSAAAAVRAA
jgi:heme A synthase